LNQAPTDDWHPQDDHLRSKKVRFRFNWVDKSPNMLILLMLISKSKTFNHKSVPMKKCFALLSLSFLLSLGYVQAQPYQNAFGLRVGSANGVSWHQFFGRSQTGLETMLVYRRGGARVIGMLTQHLALGRQSDSYLYAGIGGHAGMTGVFVEDRYNQQAYGVDFMVGFQYVFPYSPFAVSFDIKPMIELVGGARFSGNNAGVSLRYLID
jgi:hypothetical protein